MNWGKFTIWVIVLYIGYYTIMIFVETLKKKNNNVKSSDDEFFSVDDLLEETPVDVQSIEVDTEVEEFIKKKN